MSSPNHQPNCFREGSKKPIEFVIMITPCRTPPPSFLRTVIALGNFFRNTFWVCLKQTLAREGFKKKHSICDHDHTSLE